MMPGLKSHCMLRMKVNNLAGRGTSCVQSSYLYSTIDYSSVLKVRCYFYGPRFIRQLTDAALVLL